MSGMFPVASSQSAWFIAGFIQLIPGLGDFEQLSPTFIDLQVGAMPAQAARLVCRVLTCFSGCAVGGPIASRISAPEVSPFGRYDRVERRVFCKWLGRAIHFIR